MPYVTIFATSCFENKYVGSLQAEQKFTEGSLFFTNLLATLNKRPNTQYSGLMLVDRIVANREQISHFTKERS